MHTYDHVVPEGEFPDLPPIATLRFNSADDVVELARLDRSMGWSTWPEVWHLDDDGQCQCYFKGSSMDSIRSWADDPSPLHRSREEGLANGGCARRWVIVDSRPLLLRPPPTVDESDVAAFVHLRQDLGSIGVVLVDDVVFDDQGHWWSIQELISGTTAWSPP